jgi:hypothetical protein
MTSNTLVDPINRKLAMQASNALRPIFPLLKELKEPESAKMIFGEFDVVQTIGDFIQELYDFGKSETKQSVTIDRVIETHSLRSFIVHVQTFPSATIGETTANTVLYEIYESIHQLANAFSHKYCMSQDDRKSIVNQLECKCSEICRTYGTVSR